MSRAMVAIREVLPIALVGAGALALGMTGALKSAPKHTCDYPPVEVTSSVYRVNMNSNTGGSAVLTAGGWYSAAHVLNVRGDLEVAPEVGEKWDAQPIYGSLVNPESDAGWFQSPMAHRGTLRWTERVPERGERVWAIGYPLGKDLTVTEGRVHGITNEAKWLYHSAPAMSGMSGGAVVTCDQERGWELVGITAAIAMAPQHTPMGVIGNVVPFMGYASTARQHLDNREAHNWGDEPW